MCAVKNWWQNSKIIYRKICRGGGRVSPLPITGEIEVANAELSITPEAGLEARNLDISYSTARKIIRKIIPLYPSKIGFHQLTYTSDRNSC